MKRFRILNFATLLFFLAVSMVSLTNCSSEVKIDVYELLPDNSISSTPEKAILEDPKNELWFVHMPSNPDVSYPVYELPGGQYKYYFTVRDGRTRSYFFNY